MTKKSKNTPPGPTRGLARLILICFFLSGMTALIYEIIWMRMISRVIGGAPFAISTILAVFMGGMGFGSFIASRKVDQVADTKLVRLYGALELAIGLYALFVPILLILFRPFYSVLYDALVGYTLLYNLAVFAGSLILLSLPVICMGATLPILCRFYVSNLSHLGAHAGRLYGLNTLGAAAGALLCGFLLIEHLGVLRTMLLAVSLNLTIGITCLNIRPKWTGKAPKAKRATARFRQTHPMDGKIPPEPNAIRGALVIFLISGFCAMAYQVLWTRLLGLIVGPTTYSFTIVVVTFIVGLAVGNMVFGRLADKAASAIGLLVTSQIAAALLALAASHTLGNSQLFFAKLIYAYQDSFGLLSFSKAVTLSAFMTLPTFLLGATFPLVAKICTRSVSNVGRSIGVAYAVNTIGAVLGSACAGFVLIPLAGKENALQMVVGLQIATASIVGTVILRRKRLLTVHWAALAATLVAGIGLCVSYPSWNRQLLATGRYHRFEETTAVDEMIQSTGWIESLLKGPQILSASERGELVYYGDGVGGFTAVLKYPGPFGMPEFSMSNAGKMDASSRGDMKTQTLLAHLPMLFAHAPRNVMVLGLASGVTGGEVLHYPIEQLDVIDINERVFEASRFFEAWNNNVLSDRKTRLIVQDGLAHLSLTRKSYDVIVSEPSNPWMAGMAALFTKEFFELARGKLTADGIYVQWFHCYQMDWTSFSLIGRTFVEVFPKSILVSAEPGGLGRDFLFVGFKNSSGPNWDVARNNIRYTQRSTNIELLDPELLYRMIVSEDLKRQFGSGPINTHDRPLLEYAAPKLMHRDQRTQQQLLEELAKRAWLSPETKRASHRIRQSVESQIQFAEYALSVYSPFPHMVDLARANATQRERLWELLESYCATNPIDFTLFQDQSLIKRLRALQIASIRSRIGDMKGKPVAYSYLARLYVAEGMVDEAIESFQNALLLDRDDAQSHNDLGFLLYREGKIEEALSHYKEALRIRPNFVLALGNAAFANLEQNRLDEALHYFRETLRVRPDLAKSHYHVGQILYGKAQLEEAAMHLEEAIRIEPNLVEALNTLAWVLATAADMDVRDPEQAIEYAQRATLLSGEDDPASLVALAIAYAAAEQPEASYRTAEKALELARESGREDMVELIQRHIRSR